MKELALRLAALDPDASTALRIIARFDQLTSRRVDLSTIVQEAATLAGCPARLVDQNRRLSVRAEPGGAAGPAVGAVDPQWLSAPLPGEDAGGVWLERTESTGLIHAVVLERAANAAATVIRQAHDTSTRLASAHPVELVTDATLPEPDRLRAARRLGLAPDARARAVAVYGVGAYVEPDPPTFPAPYQAERAGIGRAVPVAELPSSWVDARTALRFTAEGSHLDPGPRIVAYAELGGLALLATAVGPGTRPVPDVQALADVAAAAPWVLTTLTALVDADSMRTAASTLPVHHSTFQYRLSLIERQLGWTVRDPRGRLRLQVALVLRRLHHNQV